MRETIGDVDILATADDEGDAAAIMTAFRGLAEATDNSKKPSGEDNGGSDLGVVVSGPTKTSIRVATGLTGQSSQRQSLQVDLRVVKPDCYGAALQYFTGSQAHNVAVRQIAVRAGCKLSEYGLFRVRDGAGEELIASATEEEVYAALGLQWVPPPMREDSGEVSLASRGELPKPVQVTDMRGDLHTHTNLTDGVASLAQMVAAAERKGYEYYAVTDHAPNLFMQRMTDEKVLAQRAELEAIKTRRA